MIMAINKSNILKFARDLCKYFPQCVAMCLFGAMCAMWFDLWKNENDNTLTSLSLFISVIALFLSNYFIVENAIESRHNKKKKLFSEYCARFSSNQNICKVSEWLLTIAEFDPNGILINVYPNGLNGDKGRNITEPTYFEKMCYFDFLVELNIQVKNNQLDKEDIRKYFSPCALIFIKVLQAEDMKNYYMRSLADLSEIL